jgi:NAD-dependent dihydropyrimidine dehydrogenase PreA subunit
MSRQETVGAFPCAPIKYRGGVKINHASCKGCGRCYDMCPADIFGFNAETRLVTVDYPEECWYCGACIFECPSKGTIQLDLPMTCL